MDLRYGATRSSGGNFGRMIDTLDILRRSPMDAFRVCLERPRQDIGFRRRTEKYSKHY